MSPTQLNIDLANLSDCGQNVRAGLVNGFLVLVLDTKVDLGPSSTGKMRGVGSTGGFAPLPGSLKGNVYIGRKP